MRNSCHGTRLSGRCLGNWLRCPAIASSVNGQTPGDRSRSAARGMRARQRLLRYPETRAVLLCPLRVMRPLGKVPVLSSTTVYDLVSLRARVRGVNQNASFCRAAGCRGQVLLALPRD